MKRGSELWLWLLIAAAVLSQTGLNLVRPTTTYKLLDLGAHATLIGSVTAAYALVPLGIAMILGRYTDRSPRLRTMMGVGALLLAAGSAIMALTSSIGLVVLSNVVLGMGHLFFTLAGQSAIARFSPPDRLDRGFGWFTAAFALGQLIGPLLGGLVLGTSAEEPQITIVMWLGAAFALSVVPLMFFGRPPANAVASADPASDEGPAAALKPTAMAILRRPGLSSHIVASLALLSTIDILAAFLPLVAESAGVAPVYVGLLLALRALASIASRALLPLLARRFRREHLVIASLVGAGVVLALPPLLISEIWIASALMLVGGFFLGLGQPLTMTLVTTAVPAGWRGAALATRLMGNRLGQVVIPVAAGLAVAPLGPAGPIWFTCVLLLASGTEKLLRPGRRGA